VTQTHLRGLHHHLAANNLVGDTGFQSQTELLIPLWRVDAECVDESTEEETLKYLSGPTNEIQTEFPTHTNDSGKVDLLENGVGAEYTVALVRGDLPSVIAILRQ